MAAYGDFAQVYDSFMDNVPYEAWFQRIRDLLQEAGIRDGLVLDLCCGTGKLTRLLRDGGYDMIGIDASYEMLEIAREAELATGQVEVTPAMSDAEDVSTENDEGVLEEEKASQDAVDREKKKEILYLNQDAREFELYGTVAAIISACDSLNYMTEPEDLREVFRLANNYLEAGGLFLFDLNTPYKYEKLLADHTFAESREDGAFIWDNYFDEESRINEYLLTLFLQEEDGRFARSEEDHYERAYSLEEIKRLLEEAGMEFVAVFDGYSDKPLRADSERMLIVAKEKKVKGKYYV